ncbi:MAG: protein kinase domain-containing protein [Candidatus Binataceae bacterium]
MNCPACDHANQPGERYCGGCGKALDSAAAKQSAGASVPGTLAESHPESFGTGRYKVIRLLGTGGSKRVYLARDSALNRDVAVSVIGADGGLDEAGRSRLTHEARALGVLGDHPHIATIYDIGELDGRPYIVSQYLPGGTLADLLAHSPSHRLAIAEAIRYADEICQALEYTHSHGIVHRDVKPSSVWLSELGTAALGDFGLAFATGQTHLTASGMMIGTAGYMAPEQALGQPLELQSDLYSLGVTLYELLTGRLPFTGDNVLAVVSQHINAPPPAMSTLRTDIPAALDALVMKLLAKSPAARPASAAEVRDALRAISGRQNASMDAIVTTVMAERPDLKAHAAPDGTVTILFSDIENSTVLTERLGDKRAQEFLHAHNAIIRKELAQYRGHEVKSMGDGFMVAFTSARTAVECAIAIQRSFETHCRAHPELALRVRVGLNTGEAITESGDLYGRAVIMAARVSAKADGREILVSAVTRDILRGVTELHFDDGRDFELKGLAGVHRIYRVLWDDASTTAATTPEFATDPAPLPGRITVPTVMPRQWGRTAAMLAVISIAIIAALYYGRYLTIGQVKETVAPVQKGAFTLAGQMIAPRVLHTATLLPDGTVLIAGGKGDQGPLASTEIYSPRDGTFRAGPSMLEPRFAHAATLLTDGSVIVTGGFNWSKRVLNSVEIYDSTTRRWRSAAPLGVPRYGHTATLLPSGKVLLAGGSNLEGEMRNTQVYNPVSNMSAPVEPLTEPRTRHTAATLSDGRVVLIGGVNDQGLVLRDEIFDPVNDTWSDGAKLAHGRYGLAAVMLPDHRAIILGGEDSTGVLDSAEIFDPELHAWSPLSSMKVPRYGPAAAALTDGTVIVTGGQDALGNILSSVERYTP